MAQATESQIAMWRAAIALLWVNQQIDEAEKSRLIQYFKDNIHLTDAQRVQLIKDMDQPIALQDVWGSITDTQDRAHLIDIAPTLFSEHGTPTVEERATYNEMLSEQLATIDEKAFQQEIRAAKANFPAEQAEEEAEVAAEFDNWGAVGRMLYHFDKMLGIV